MVASNPQQQPQRQRQRLGKGRQNASSSHLQLNAAICSMANNHDVEGLLCFVSARASEMSLVNVSTALHRLAREAMERQSRVVGDPRLLTLVLSAKEEIARPSTSNGDATPRCASTIAWASVRLGLADDKLMALVADLATALMSKFKPFEFTNLLWAFAKRGHRHQQLFKHAYDHIAANLQAFPAQTLSLLVWIFATVEYTPAKSLLCRAAELFVASAATVERTAVTIENLVWGLATMQVHVKPSTMKLVGDMAVAVLESFKAHELSITLWAFARLKVEHRSLFAAAAELLGSSPSLRADIHSQGVSNMLWAFAKNGDLPLFEKTLPLLAQICQSLFQDLKPQEFSSMLWAISRSSIRWGDDSCVDRIFMLAASIDKLFISELSLTGAVNILEACAKFAGGKAERPRWCCAFSQLLTCHCASFGEKLDSTSALRILEAQPDAVDKAFSADDAHVGALSAVAAAAGRGVEEFPRGQLFRLAACTSKLRESSEVRGLLACVIARQILRTEGMRSSQERADVAIMCGEEGDASLDHLTAALLRAAFWDGEEVDDEEDEEAVPKSNVGAADALVLRDPCYICPVDGTFVCTDSYAFEPKLWVCISAVEEMFDSCEDVDPESGKVGIAFEVACSFGSMDLEISIETWCSFGLLDSCLCPATADSSWPSLYKIRLELPRVESTLRFVPRDQMGCIVGETLVLPLQSTALWSKHLGTCAYSVSGRDGSTSTHAGGSNISEGSWDCMASSSSGSTSPQYPP